MKTILIADDHGISRSGLRAAIERDTDYEVVGEARNGLEAVSLATEHRPNAIFMDLAMPGGVCGIEATKEIKRELPDVHIIGVSSHQNPTLIADMMDAGASGYVLKESIVLRLQDVLTAVLDEERVYLDPGVDEFDVEEARAAKRQKGTSDLSASQRRVLAGIASGESVHEIAEAQGISPKTVETHIATIKQKKGVKTVAGMTMLAVGYGLVHE